MSARKDPKGETSDNSALDYSKNEIAIQDQFRDKYVALSNSLIQAREKNSLLEGKLELLSIFKMNSEMNTTVKKDAKGDAYSVHYVEINAKELRSMMNRKGGSLYNQIEAAALDLARKIYIYRDPGQKAFTYDHLYGEVRYRDGQLYIEFNPNTEYLFLDLKDNFSKIKLDVAFLFRTNGGLQLYKLLKSGTYTLPPIDYDIPQEEQPSVKKKYSLGELRMQLGYVDLNNQNVQREGLKANPDIDKILAMEKQPKYRRWTDFMERVINPGVAEINEVSELYVSSIEKVCGAHGKIEDVIITVQNNVNFRDKKRKASEKKNGEPLKRVMSEEELDAFIDEIRLVIGEPLSTRALKKIASVADYQKEKVEKAYAAAQAYKGNIEDLEAFLVAAIEKGYEPPVKKKTAGSSKVRTKGGREYDVNELEEKLLRRKR